MLSLYLSITMMTLIVTEVIFPIMDFAQTNYCISAKVTTLANLPSVELQRGIRNEMIDKKFGNNKTSSGMNLDCEDCADSLKLSSQASPRIHSNVSQIGWRIDFMFDF